MSGITLGSALVFLFGFAANACATDPEAKSARLVIATVEHGGKRTIVLTCRSGEPDAVLVVGLVGTPALAREETDPADDALWQDAAIQFACRAPIDGVVRLELDMRSVREAIGDDVRLIAEVARRATLVVFSDSGVKDGGSKVTRPVRSADLSDSLQSFGAKCPCAPGAGSLGWVPAEGFGRVALDASESRSRAVARLAD